MKDQLERYQARRAAATLSDGTRPYAWWKKYQQRLSILGELSAAELRRDAARLAKQQRVIADEERHD